MALNTLIIANKICQKHHLRPKHSIKSLRENVGSYGAYWTGTPNTLPFVLYVWYISSLFQVFYKTLMPVPANRELVVFYGASYAKELGYEPDKELTPWQIYKNPGKYDLL